MGYTNRKFPVMEIAISLTGKANLPSGHERKQLGDIIAIRKPHSVIGSKEVTEFLWLRIEGIEEDLMMLLQDIVESTGQPSVVYDKRRYCIPLRKLKKFFPSFDIGRAMDKTDIYQPFIVVDEDEPHIYLADLRPLRIEGLVFDKLKGIYL